MEKSVEELIVERLILEETPRERILEVCGTSELGLDLGKVQAYLNVGRGVVPMITEASLSMNDFTKYFESDRLGRLYFPNGKCFTPHGTAFENGEITQFHIDLKDLYKLVTGWKINDTGVPLDDIVGVVAFGSAVKYPGYEEVIETKRKYKIFGQKLTKTKQVSIQPDDADFLVITEQDLLREKVLKPISLETYDCGTWIREGGIHLVNRGIEQVVNGVQAGDTISSSAMREGIPIFYNGRLEGVQARTGIPKETPRRIDWDTDKRGYLFGEIK
jgi:hypothetical protein